MLIKIYAFVWILLAAVACLLYAAGNFGETVLTVFGFLFSGLFFAGIVMVLPWWLDKHHARYLPQK